jgi:hypothetical protein
MVRTAPKACEQADVTDGRVIDELLQQPDAFEIVDAGDPYRTLGILRPEETAAWSAARRESLAAAQDQVLVSDSGRLIAFAILSPLPLDSEALGIPVASVRAVGFRRDTATERAAVFENLLTAVRSSCDVALITALVDLDQCDLLEALQTSGAHVFGANNTWIAALATPGDVNAEKRIRSSEAPLTPAGRRDLLGAVTASYATYRSHYHADPRLSAADCSAPYVAAVRHHLDTGGAVDVIHERGAVAAFSTIEPHNELNSALGSPLVAEIGIAGVTPSARGKGLFSLALANAVDGIARRGFAHAFYGCSSSNYAAQRSLVADGRFQLRRATLRLHWWLDR